MEFRAVLGQAPAGALPVLAELTVLAILTVLPAPAAAQQPERALMVIAGPSQYDLGGTGTAPFGAVRLALPLGRTFVFEPGLTYLSYTSQFDPRIHHILPEAQLQAQLPGETFRPYLGAGLGASLAVSEGDEVMDLTLSGAAGVRVLLGSGWMLGGELRVRVIDPWTGTTADWGFGLGRRL